VMRILFVHRFLLAALYPCSVWPSLLSTPVDATKLKAQAALSKYLKVCMGLLPVLFVFRVGTRIRTKPVFRRTTPPHADSRARRRS
jgi:hypothetical protein